MPDIPYEPSNVPGIGFLGQSFLPRQGEQFGVTSLIGEAIRDFFNTLQLKPARNVMRGAELGPFKFGGPGFNPKDIAAARGAGPAGAGSQGFMPFDIFSLFGSNQGDTLTNTLLALQLLGGLGGDQQTNLFSGLSIGEK